MAPLEFMPLSSSPKPHRLAPQDRAYRAMRPSPTKPNELKRPPHAAYTQ
ncbi:hypothetical protein AHGSH82_023660 [Aeromonas hydrophila]|nr:hypothetical protein AHGSH82_023660 [Aeromonas hydrophila]